MEENRGSVSACICDTGSWNVCRKAGTWSFIWGRVEYLSYHHTAKRKSFQWTGYLDLLCVFLAFQHIFNRIACLCEGCCMGKPYSGIFAFWYRANGKSGAGFSYPVWPVQIFEISGMVILLILFFALHTKKKHFADVFSMGFAVCIFLSEFMMDQTGVLLIAGLSVIQYAAIVLFVTGIFIHRCFKSRQR